ncbi:DUF444 family protein [Botrimarina sp.]|uniref:DUF444 family protein n=1 Tax=Botrimarina sp. TaxID=2795802 RepID=UPI0032EBE409
MSLPIERDVRRFRQIVRGKVRENLKRYVSHGEMLGRKGKDVVSIPVPSLDVPRFRFGDNSGGVGQGEGEEGESIGQGQGQGGQGAGGEAGAEHYTEVDVPLEELAALLAEELELPNIEPRGKAAIQAAKAKYNSVRSTGPESLRHNKRTYLKALQREISTGGYNPTRPNIIPVKGDKRYRSWTSVDEPMVNAAVIYVMDVSGSMTDEQKSVVRNAAFWIDAYLKSQYTGLERRYIIHDAVAKEVDEHAFYHTRESGGTRVSSGYRVCAELIEQQLPPAEWNLYVFQFSDGDNWGEDNDRAFTLLGERILPHVNQFAYGQVESPYGSGELLGQIESRFGDKHDNLVCCEIEDRDAIYPAIKTFLGAGR